MMMNTASKLGLHTQTDRGTCPGVGLRVYRKRTTQKMYSEAELKHPAFSVQR
jgi:hypothetical protein